MRKLGLRAVQRARRHAHGPFLRVRRASVRVAARRPRRCMDPRRHGLGRLQRPLGCMACRGRASMELCTTWFAELFRDATPSASSNSERYLKERLRVGVTRRSPHHVHHAQCHRRYRERWADAPRASVGDDGGGARVRSAPQIRRGVHVRDEDVRVRAEYLRLVDRRSTSSAAHCAAGGPNERGSRGRAGRTNRHRAQISRSRAVSPVADARSVVDGRQAAADGRRQRCRSRR